MVGKPVFKKWNFLQALSLTHFSLLRKVGKFIDATFLIIIDHLKTFLTNHSLNLTQLLITRIKCFDSLNIFEELNQLKFQWLKDFDFVVDEHFSFVWWYIDVVVAVFYLEVKNKVGSGRRIVLLI